MERLQLRWFMTAVVFLGLGILIGLIGTITLGSDTILIWIPTLLAYLGVPIAIGFGVSTPEQARTVAGYGDAVVVGSAIVNQIAEHGKSPDLVPRVAGFVKSLADAVKTNSNSAQ